MNLISNSLFYTFYLFFRNSYEDLLKKKTLQKNIQSENRFLQLVARDTNVNFILKILKNGMLLI